MQEIKRYVITVFVIMIVCVMQIAIQLKIFIDLHQQFTLILSLFTVYIALKCKICSVSFVLTFDRPFSTGWRMIICFNRYSRYLHKAVFAIRTTMWIMRTINLFAHQRASYLQESSNILLSMSIFLLSLLIRSTTNIHWVRFGFDCVSPFGSIQFVSKHKNFAIPCFLFA